MSPAELGRLEEAFIALEPEERVVAFQAWLAQLLGKNATPPLRKGRLDALRRAVLRDADNVNERTLENWEKGLLGDTTQSAKIRSLIKNRGRQEWWTFALEEAGKPDFAERAAAQKLLWEQHSARKRPQSATQIEEQVEEQLETQVEVQVEEQVDGQDDPPAQPVADEHSADTSDTSSAALTMPSSALRLDPIDVTPAPGSEAVSETPRVNTPIARYLNSGWKVLLPLVAVVAALLSLQDMLFHEQTPPADKENREPVIASPPVTPSPPVAEATPATPVSPLKPITPAIAPAKPVTPAPQDTRASAAQPNLQLTYRYQHAGIGWGVLHLRHPENFRDYRFEFSFDQRSWQPFMADTYSLKTFPPSSRVFVKGTSPGGNVVGPVGLDVELRRPIVDDLVESAINLADGSAPLKMLSQQPKDMPAVYAVTLGNVLYIAPIYFGHGIRILADFGDGFWTVIKPKEQFGAMKMGPARIELAPGKPFYNQLRAAREIGIKIELADGSFLPDARFAFSLEELIRNQSQTRLDVSALLRCGAAEGLVHCGGRWGIDIGWAHVNRVEYGLAPDALNGSVDIFATPLAYLEMKRLPHNCGEGFIRRHFGIDCMFRLSAGSTVPDPVNRAAWVSASPAAPDFVYYRVVFKDSQSRVYRVPVEQHRQ